MKKKVRCEWCLTDPVYMDYHDLEWGMPVHDDRKQFEFLVLESAQAGLSWLTILKRREGYRRLYSGFNAAEVAHFDDSWIRETMLDPSIIRNLNKIESSINNAQRFLAVQDQFGSFCNYIWGFVDGKQVVNHFIRISDIPATTPLSDKISKDLKQRGFKFLGSTIVYAHLQATGLVNDHLADCFRFQQCKDQ